MVWRLQPFQQVLGRDHVWIVVMSGFRVRLGPPATADASRGTDQALVLTATARNEMPRAEAKLNALAFERHLLNKK